jgi:cytoskeleton protein RodZ
MPEIGATLREARMRARIDVSEIEAQTKIRAKYLRALENEEWDLLPGPTFVKSFLRTYAQALELDGKALVEEYRLNHERLNESDLQPMVSSPSRARQQRSSRGQRPSRQRPGATSPGLSRGYMVAIGAVGLIIVLLVIGLVSKSGSSKHPATTTPVKSATSGSGADQTGARHTKPASSTSSEVSLSLTPSAAVYVCLIGDGVHRLISGQTLPAGASTPTYHARRFTITLGNSSVKLVLDGTPRTVAPSSKPIGYSITRAGRRVLAPGSLPTCGG